MKKILFLTILLLAVPLFSENFKIDNTDKSNDKKMRIAVMDFEAKDIPSKDAVKYTELIRNDIVNSGHFIVIERSQMGQILKEQGFQQTGCTDVSCAVEIGKILSAKKILVGSVMKIEDQIIITGRIVDVENGIVEFSEKSIAANKKEVVPAISIFVENLAGRIGKPDIVNEYKKPYKMEETIIVKDGDQSSENPYSGGMIWSLIFTSSFFGGGYYFETQISKINTDISKLEIKYKESVSTIEAVSLHKEIASQQDKSKKLVLYRNIFYGAGSVAAVFMGYYFYNFLAFDPVKANVSDNYNIPIIFPVCWFDPDNDRNSDIFFLGAGLTVRF